jgi:hypothetical protein
MSERKAARDADDNRVDLGERVTPKQQKKKKDEPQRLVNTSDKMHNVPGFDKKGKRMERLLKLMPGGSKKNNANTLTLGDVMKYFPTVESFTRSYSTLVKNTTEIENAAARFADAMNTAKGTATPAKQVRKKLTQSQRRKLKKQMQSEQQREQEKVKEAKKAADRSLQRAESDIMFARVERGQEISKDLFGAGNVNVRRGSSTPPKLYGSAPDLEGHALTTAIINSQVSPEEQKQMATDQQGLMSGDQRAYSKEMDGVYAPTQDHDKPLNGHKGSVAPGMKHINPAASTAAPGAGANLGLVRAQGLETATHNASDEQAEQKKLQDIAFAAQGVPNSSSVANGDESKGNGGTALPGATLNSVQGKSSKQLFTNNPLKLAVFNENYPDAVDRVLNNNTEVNSRINTGIPTSVNVDAEMQTPPAKLSRRQQLVQNITPKARALQRAVNSNQKKKAREIAIEIFDELSDQAKNEVLNTPQLLAEEARSGLSLEEIAGRSLAAGLLAAAPTAGVKGGRPFMSGALSAAAQAVWDIWSKYAGPSSPGSPDVEQGLASRMGQAAAAGLAGGAGVVGAAVGAAGVAVAAERLRRVINGMYDRLWPEGADVPDQAQAEGIVDELEEEGANIEQAQDIQARMADDPQRNNVEPILRDLLKKPDAAEPSDEQQKQQQAQQAQQQQQQQQQGKVLERRVVPQSRGMPVFTPGGGAGMGSTSPGEQGVAAGRDHEACSSRSKYLEGELRPFLPIAGGEVVQLDPGEVLRKKVSLALWESMRGRNPNGTLYTNRLLRQNQYNWDLRMRDPLYITPVIEGPGYGMNQGVMPWGQRDKRPFQTPAWRRKLQDGLKRASIRHQTGNPKTAEKLLMMEKESAAKQQILRLMATDQSFTNNPVSKGVHHPQEGFQESNVLNIKLVNVEPPLNTVPTLAVLPTPFERPRMSRVSAYGFPPRGPISRTSALWKPPVTWRRTAVNPQIEPPDNFQEDINTTDRWDSNEGAKVRRGVKREPVMQILDPRVRKRPMTVRRRDL